MRLRFWRSAEADRQPADRETALRALRSLKNDRLLRPPTEPTSGSVNDDFWTIQAGLSGLGAP
jgi:hypothetical protein